MIQFNLLPDVKQEFVKVNRVKRITMFISTLVSLVAIIIFVLLLSWYGLQKKNLSDINRDIGTYKQQLTGIHDLNKILTIQNQLTSLQTLDKQKPLVSPLFGYLSQITPSNATISSLDVEFGPNTITLSGGADNLTTINIFADTLKFTTYSLANNPKQSKLAFSKVVLSSFSLSSVEGATYTFTFNFDPNLFSSASTATLTVPPEVTTRSVLDQPTDLFKESTVPSSGTNTGGNQ